MIVFFPWTIWLGDDWQCTETGPVEDIHFWISWWGDNIELIPFINISIYSNNDTAPSHPEELLWTYTFSDYEFNITAPEVGDQGFYTPDGPWEE
ncbi:unnamed protein product, partial [marine sediment metagenome]